MHPVGWCDWVAFAGPSFAAHVNAGLAVAPDDDNGQTRQALRRSHVVDNALYSPDVVRILWRPCRENADGEERCQQSEHSSSRNHDALCRTR
jgi:hypothetical protein